MTPTSSSEDNNSSGSNNSSSTSSSTVASEAKPKAANRKDASDDVHKKEQQHQSDKDAFDEFLEKNLPKGPVKGMAAFFLFCAENYESFCSEKAGDDDGEIAFAMTQAYKGLSKKEVRAWEKKAIQKADQFKEYLDLYNNHAFNNDDDENEHESVADGESKTAEKVEGSKPAAKTVTISKKRKKADKPSAFSNEARNSGTSNPDIKAAPEKIEKKNVEKFKTEISSGEPPSKKRKKNAPEKQSGAAKAEPEKATAADGASPSKKSKRSASPKVPPEMAHGPAKVEPEKASATNTITRAKSAKGRTAETAAQKAIKHEPNAELELADAAEAEQNPERPKTQQKKKREPGEPKRNLSSFMHFNNMNRSKVKEEHPDLNFREIARHLTSMYNNLSPTERQRFEKIAAADKTRYQTEYSEWLDSRKKQQTAPLEQGTMVQPKPKADQSSASSSSDDSSSSSNDS